MNDPLMKLEPGGQDRQSQLEKASENNGRGAAVLRSSPFDRDVWAVLGLPVDAANIDQAVAGIDRAIETGEQLSFVTPNVNWLVRASSCSTARREIMAADLSLVDGAPLAAAAKLLGVPIEGRVAGSDLFEALRRRPPFGGRRVSVFFFGGREGSAEAASAALDSAPSGLSAAGWINPGFGDVDDMSTDAIIDEINAADPDFVVVALGAAKGQAWIERNRDRLNARVIAHLGAVVDFTAGGIARAPGWVQKLGLEWAWRIKEEPSLWRRYAADGAALVRILTTRLLPLLISLKRQKSTGDPKVALDRQAGVTYLSLTGDHERADLTAVRAAFAQIETSGGDVVLRLDELGRIDMALLGLVLLLEQKLMSQDRTLRITGAVRAHKAIFTSNGLRIEEFNEDGQSQPIESAISAAG